MFGSLFDSFHRCENNIIISVRRLYKIFWPCAMLGWPQWPISILISGTLISKDFPTFFPLYSSNSLHGPMPVATNSPNSILHMIVGYRSQAIARWSWLSRRYRKGRKACKCAAVWLYANVKHGIGPKSPSRSRNNFKGLLACQRCVPPPPLSPFPHRLLTLTLQGTSPTHCI